jgi:excisionase family DNA binding protein
MQLLDSDAAARRLGVRRLRLYALVRSGDIPAVRMGARSLRFDPSALDRFIRSGGVQSTSAHQGLSVTGREGCGSDSSAVSKRSSRPTRVRPRNTV